MIILYYRESNFHLVFYKELGEHLHTDEGWKADSYWMVPGTFTLEDE